MRLLAFSEIQNSQLYLPSMHSPISLGLLVVTEKLGRSVENHRCFGLGTTVDPPESASVLHLWESMSASFSSLVRESRK